MYHGADVMGPVEVYVVPVGIWSGVVSGGRKRGSTHRSANIRSEISGSPHDVTGVVVSGSVSPGDGRLQWRLGPSPETNAYKASEAGAVVDQVRYDWVDSATWDMKVPGSMLMSVYGPLSGPAIGALGIRSSGRGMSTTVDGSAFASLCFPSSDSSMADGQHLVNQDTAYRPAQAESGEDGTYQSVTSSYQARPSWDLFVAFLLS